MAASTAMSEPIGEVNRSHEGIVLDRQATVSILSIAQPHLLPFRFLRGMLRLLREIPSESRILIIAPTHRKALLADILKLVDIGQEAALAFSALGH
jgi:hypothetical protein